MKQLKYTGSLVSAMLLLFPTNRYRIAVWSVAVVVACAIYLVHSKNIKFNWSVRPCMCAFFANAWLGVIFITRWENAGIVARLASLIYCTPSVFLTLAVSILSVTAIPGSILIVSGVVYGLEKLAPKHRNNIVQYSVIGAVVITEYIQIFFSAMFRLDFLLYAGISRLAGNVIVVLAFNIFVLLLVQKWKLALKLTSVITGIYCIVNTYVVLYHGSPFFASEIASALTAMDVVSQYRFSLNLPVVAAVLLMGGQILLIGFVQSEKEPKFRIIVRGLALCVIAGTIAVLFRSWNTHIVWSWKSAVIEYGYSMTYLADSVSMGDTIRTPDGYAVDLIQQPQLADSSENTIRPDVILILNETFYDLRKYTNVSAERDWLQELDFVEGIVRGYAEVPSISTNNSEFELLTSKSMYLLSRVAPFNYLDFTEAKSSVVEYFNMLGYSTYAMHVAKENYSRHKAYPALGFDQVILGSQAFTESFNGNRLWTDEANYTDLLRYYEESGDEPRFMYLLTMQNHGGYEQNPQELDTIHVNEDFGDLTDDINEYLTSIELSAKAFRGITEYFRNSDRPVIVVMVGDHPPAFISELTYKSNNMERAEIDKLLVPYVMWSNCGVEFSGCREEVSLVDIVPLIIDSAHLPMTGFYQTVLAANEQYPVRTSSGRLVDGEGIISSYSAANDNIDVLSQYYFMEYNSLAGGPDYLEKIFIP